MKFERMDEKLPKLKLITQIPILSSTTSLHEHKHYITFFSSGKFGSCMMHGECSDVNFHLSILSFKYTARLRIKNMFLYQAMSAIEIYKQDIPWSFTLSVVNQPTKHEQFAYFIQQF